MNVKNWKPFTSRDNLYNGNKINKPPTFPTFSGMTAVSRPFFRLEVHDKMLQIRQSEML